jgi:hypothetical protein
VEVNIRRLHTLRRFRLRGRFTREVFFEWCDSGLKDGLVFDLGVQSSDTEHSPRGLIGAHLVGSSPHVNTPARWNLRNLYNLRIILAVGLGGSYYRTTKS